MKKCFKCELTKPLTEFYKHSQLKGGRLNKCKTCSKEDSNKRYFDKLEDKEWVEKERNRKRILARKLTKEGKLNANPEVVKKSNDNYRKNYPEKIKATMAANNIRKKDNSNHNHHWSYNKEHWKDVIEIKPCNHYKIHRFLIYDKDSKLYISKEGYLLDTKEKHIDYIKKIIDEIDIQ